MAEEKGPRERGERGTRTDKRADRRAGRRRETIESVDLAREFA